ncbi:O-antigen ligase family protein [Comamonas faecalis]|uniref:O-antigen ligase family protein n=1 Tax=Comamonas faecalis TaxID=1387849 RepID=UPI0031EA7FDE
MNNMKTNIDRINIEHHDSLASNAVAFMVPGFALGLPSGYSWGAIVLLLTSLVAWRAWWLRPCKPLTYWWSGSIFLMGMVWSLDAHVGLGWSSLDRTSKYLLVLPGLFYLMARPPSLAALRWGVAIGGLGAGTVALYQMFVLNIGRPEGFTNAIQFGNISLLLALMGGLWLALRADGMNWKVSFLLGFGVLFGVLGSMLSQSRGGWLALGASLPLWIGLLWYWGRHRLVAYTLVGLCTVTVFAAGAVGGIFKERILQAYQESSIYMNRSDEERANSSVGLRLDYWKLAWAMGKERPWLGWGDEYTQEKQRRVAAGEAHPRVLELGHAHNEFLDMFSKRGLIGVGALLLFYGVPMALFWPSKRRCNGGRDAIDRDALALCFVGLSIPVLYLGFGWTQVFFAHNSGNLFYLLMISIVYAALQIYAGDHDSTKK